MWVDDLRLRLLHDAASGPDRLADPLTYPLALHIVTSRALIVSVVLPNTLAIGRGYLAIPLCRGPYELCSTA